MKEFLTMLTFFFLIGLNPIYSLWVDESEIKTDKPVEFKNYSGEYNVSEEESEIRGIGKKLAEISIRNNEWFQYQMKYSIFHAILEKETNKLSADILSIDKQAKIKHINGLRLVLGSYLSKKYGYTEVEGKVLSIFLTYYNALNKGNMDLFKGKYNSVVLSNITIDNAGLSMYYKEWPGSSKILVPLILDNIKVIRPIDSTEVSENKIIEALRKNPDKGVEDRKELVNLKEKEVGERKKDLEEKKKDLNTDKVLLTNRQKLIEKKKEDLKEKEGQIKAKEEDLKEKKDEIKDVKTPEEKKKLEEKVKNKEEEIKKDKETIVKKETEIKKEEKKLEEKKEEVKKEENVVNNAENKIAKKEEEIKKDKEEIKKDETQLMIEKDQNNVKKDLAKKDEELNKKAEELQNKDTELKTNRQKLEEKSQELVKQENELKNKQVDNKVFAGKFYYLKTKNYFGEGHYNNDLFMINALTRKI